MNDTRDRLVAAAADLFQSNGYGATSIEQILGAAKARSGSLYYHFANKEALLLAVLERHAESLWPTVLAPAFAQSDDPIVRIFAVIAEYRERLVTSKFAFTSPVGVLALETAHFSAKVRSRIEENFEAWRDAFRLCLEAAGDRFPATTDRYALATLILAVLEGALMQARAQHAIEPFDSATTELRNYLRQLEPA